MTDNVIQMIPEMVTIKKASERTGVSYDRIRKLCKQGRIVYIKTGAKYLVNFGKFVEYLNTGDQIGGDDDE